MPVDSKGPGLDAAARQDLHATIKFLSKLLEDMTGKVPKPEEIIATLRERGEHAYADEFERIVAKIRAKRGLP